MKLLVTLDVTPKENKCFKVPYTKFESYGEFNISDIYAFTFYNKTPCQKYSKTIEFTIYI